MILKGVLGVIDKFLTKMGDSNKKAETSEIQLCTEEDILRAMDALPTPEPEPVGYSIGELNCKVPKLGVWSSFEYLGESPSGMSSKDNKKLLYMIPIGVDIQQLYQRMCYLGVYFNDTISDAFEFYTTYDYYEKKEPSEV